MVHFSSLSKHNYRCTLVCLYACEYFNRWLVCSWNPSLNLDSCCAQNSLCSCLCEQCVEVRIDFLLERAFSYSPLFYLTAPRISLSCLKWAIISLLASLNFKYLPKVIISWEWHRISSNGSSERGLYSQWRKACCCRSAVVRCYADRCEDWNQFIFRRYE